MQLKVALVIHHIFSRKKWLTFADGPRAARNLLLNAAKLS